MFGTRSCPGRRSDALIEVALRQPALIPDVERAEFLTRIQEEAVAFLIRQQIGERAFIESIRGAGRQLSGT